MASGDLTTLADVKAWLQTGQNAFPTTDDALLTRLITAVSQYIQEWLNRRLAMTDYTELRDGTGGQTLQFGCFPVTAVASLTIDGQPVPPRAPSSRAAGYSFSSTQLSVCGYEFNRGSQNVAIAYTAGYPSTPPEIAQACIELVSVRYRERTRIGEVSRSLGGGETVSYSQKGLTDGVKILLQQYRLVAPVSATFPTVAPIGADAALLSGIL